LYSRHRQYIPEAKERKGVWNNNWASKRKEKPLPDLRSLYKTINEKRTTSQGSQRRSVRVSQQETSILDLKGFVHEIQTKRQLLLTIAKEKEQIANQLKAN